MDLKWKEGSRARIPSVDWSPRWAETQVSSRCQGQQDFLQKLGPFITHLAQESGKLRVDGGGGVGAGGAVTGLASAPEDQLSQQMCRNE